MTSTEEAVMAKVMKLLTLANDEGATPAERKLAEEQAERIMTKHTIDRFEAAQRLKNGDTEARKPISDTWTLQKTDNSEFDYQLVDMMEYVLRHCGCRVNPSYTLDSDRQRVYTIVGFREDMLYAERIWFNIFRTFVSNIAPKWDLDKSVGELAYIFASSGKSWQEITLIAEEAGDGRLEPVDRWQHDDPEKPFYTRNSYKHGRMIEKHDAPNPKRWNEGLGASINILRRAFKEYVAVNNIDASYIRGTKLRTSTRNSFARSYRATIKSRLDEIRQSAVQEESSGDKYALAVRDTKERVDEEFYRLFPEFDPEKRRRQREEADFLRACKFAALPKEEQDRLIKEEEKRQRAADARWRKRASSARASYGRIREDPANRIDSAAWARGQKAAQSVNLRADGEVKKENRKGIQ